MGAVMTGEKANTEIRDILSSYAFPGICRSCVRFGSGHINDTFFATYDDGGKENRYIVQRINTDVFKDVDALMDNIWRVTSFLAEKIIKNGGDASREAMTFIKNKEGALYTRSKKGACWRAYRFIEDALSIDAAQSEADFYNASYAFGTFQYLLSDFPASSLHETIPAFHDTPKRYRDFIDTVKRDACGRAASVRDEIDFYISHEDDMRVYADAYSEGVLPLRVTHNDAKLNNVLLDRETRKGLCVIDLDTVMPGFAGFDFGDAIRFGASTGAEDERDLSKVRLDEGLFRAGAEGYIAGSRGTLTEDELRLLPVGAKIMTLECGMRFLADYIEGDRYFKTDRKSHNLDRARTQIKLVREFEKRKDSLEAIVRSLASAR